LRAALAAAAALSVLGVASLTTAAASQNRGAAASVHHPGQFGAAGVRSADQMAGQPTWQIIGSPATKALFAKVHRAYLDIPAVALSVVPGSATFGFPRRFVLVLRSGTVVAEEFRRSGRDGTTLVARRGQPTYSRKTGTTCWRRLRSSNPQTLADVGVPFPYTRVPIKVLPPKRTALGWKVVSANQAEFWFLALQARRPAYQLEPLSRFITYTIHAKSHLLRSISIQQPSHKPQRNWLKATLRVSTVVSAPRLPTPAPAC